MRWARRLSVAVTALATLGVDVPERLQASGFGLPPEVTTLRPLGVSSHIVVPAEAGTQAIAAEPEPEPEPLSTPWPERKDRPTLASLARETWIFSEPRADARKLGYLRAGAVVARQGEPAGFRDCRGGWYAVEPRGFVCVGARA